MDMWEKIVLNLVSNAFKYTKQGRIVVSVTQVNQHVQLSVADTGIGIPEDQLGKIFDRFHRIDNNEGRSQEGTGIGLALVKELVKIHEGRIQVYSKQGEGSVFTVTIPVGKDHLPEDKIINDHITCKCNEWYCCLCAGSIEMVSWANRPSGKFRKRWNEYWNHEHGQGKKRRVLVADDNADMREYIERLLLDQFHVMTGVDGEDAFDKLLSFKPDLVISDIMMPKLDGFGLLKRLHDHPDTRHIPVVFLSARAGEEAKVEGLDAGAADYLIKPFSAKELIAIVNANIKIAKSQRTAESNLRNIIMQSPVSMTILRGEDLVMELANRKVAGDMG